MLPEYYYKTTASGTKFESIEPDAEPTGLNSFNEKQEEAAKKFSSGQGDILVMGGIGGIGKTYTLKRLARASGFDFVDFHSVRKHICSIDELGAKKVAKKIIDNRILRSESANLLILDEGISGIIADEQVKLRSRMDEVIHELLEKYPKLIILGGGNAYTSDEQTEMIADALPKTLDITTHPFPFKNLNLKQTADLAQRSKLGIFQDRVATPEELLSREFAEFIARLSLRYFRLFRVIIKMAGIPARSEFELYNLERNMRTLIMPDDVFQKAWEIQRGMIEEQRTQIQDLLRQ